MPLEITALSGLCVSPDERNNGIGKYLVGKVFEAIDQSACPVSLFQTSIPLFYKKFGTRQIYNRFYNSRNKRNPQANPWWDPCIMVYPGHYAWPEGNMDLNGPAY